VEYVNPNLATTADEDGTELVIEDLVEDVSIDGMCGVY
jgi:mycofactocin precursor